MDCFVEICDYLSLKNFIAFGSTCKRLCQYAGHWLKQNYPAIQYGIQGNNIYMEEYKFEIKYFSQFIQNILILDDCRNADVILQSYRYISTSCNKFLNEIEFCDVKLFRTEIEYFEEVLCKVETI